LVEGVSSAAGGVGHVTGQISSRRDLLIQKALCFLIGVGCERGGRLLRLATSLLSDVSKF
jgi:hypothetical protein